MKVCIAEKPSVAQSIASVLGANTRHSGYYEGNGYQVTWTFGHLCTLKAPHEYTDQWRQWRMDYLPMIPPRFGISLIDDEGIRRQFSVIEQLYASAECVINCGDAGQEGELIQRWVMQKAGVHCPVYRLWISSLTDDAIREGFSHLELQTKYDRLYQAGLSRAIGDWLLGMNATRLYTLRYGAQKQVLSIGRVQTPTLALIVKRHWEIANFEPTQYWELKTIYRDVTFNATQGKFNSVEEGNKALESIQNAPFIVQDVAKKGGKEAPPRLFDLTSLQVECNRKFGLSADDTLRLIQSLYEKKVTTYPRVDTTFLSEDIYPKCPEILRRLSGYEALTAPLTAPGVRLPKTKKVFDNSKVTDHHAIIPTNVPAHNLSPEERRVYDLVARRFIAVFYPDCQFNTTTVQGRAADVPFKVTGKVITAPGWRAVYADTPAATNAPIAATDNQSGEEKSDEATVGILPDFTIGESGPHVPSLLEKWTQPPKLYTEATLLRAMETAGKLCDDEELRDAMKENGLGRPSTRAAIIETLYKRHYIRKERKSLVATQTGIEVIGTIHDELLKSAELTGQWESKLRKIERGEYEAATFLSELKEMVQLIAQNVKNDRFSQRVAVTADEPKNKAKSSAKSSAKEGNVQKTGKENAPAKEKKPRAPRRKKESQDATNAVQSEAKAAEQLSVKRYTLTTLPKVCPLCGRGHLLRGRTAYGCSEYAAGCTFRIPLSEVDEGNE
jgi:DNA topoisomerase-3